MNVWNWERIMDDQMQGISSKRQHVLKEQDMIPLILEIQQAKVISIIYQ